MSLKNKDDFIEYPINGLNLSNFWINKDNQNNCTYDLYGVIHHKGSMDCGHYTATWRMNTNNNDWYLYNGKYANFNFNKSFICIWNNI